MSLETKYFFDGGVEFRPVNADKIGVKFDWTRNILEAELTTDAIILSDTPSNPAKSFVMAHYNTLGAYQGLPITVQFGAVSVDYYIDTSEQPKFSGEGDSKIEVKIKRRKAVDYFKKEADGLTFELLNTTHPIDTFKIPYLIVRDNQLELFITLTIATYNLTKALIEGIRDLVDAITEVIRAATPNAGVPPSVDTGDIIAAVLLAAARLIYVAALLIALIKIAKEIIELVFPPLKEFKVTTVRELLEKGCARLGFNFNSTVSEFSNMTILPKPILCPKEGIFKKLFTFDSGLRTLGYPTGIGGDSVTTLGALIDFCLDWCNGRLRIVGNDVFIERRDHWVINSGINIKNTLNIQSTRENQFGINSGEAWKRYFLRWQLDPMDAHTFDDVTGIYSEHSTEPVTVPHPDLVLIKGLVEKQFPFAFGSRKPGLNFIENAFLPFASFADSVVNFFGGSSNLVSSINGRVGVLQISNQYFGQTKMLYIVGKKQPANFRDIIGAEQSYQKYHYINQVKENAKDIFIAEIPFSTQNLQTLLTSNYVNDLDGEPLEVLTFEFINEAKKGTIKYARKGNAGDNTKTILIEGGGTSGTTTTALTC